MTDKEKTIKTYMEKLGISHEDAEQLWEDDQANLIGDEGEKMTKNAKKIRRYEKGESSRKKMEKTRKVDTVKKFLLDCAMKGLTEEVSKVEYHNEVSISFVYNDENFSLKLIRHNKKK